VPDQGVRNAILDGLEALEDARYAIEAPLADARRALSEAQA